MDERFPFLNTSQALIKWRSPDYQKMNHSRGQRANIHHPNDPFNSLKTLSHTSLAGWTDFFEDLLTRLKSRTGVVKKKTLGGRSYKPVFLWVRQKNKRALWLKCHPDVVKSVPAPCCALSRGGKRSRFKQLLLRHFSFSTVSMFTYTCRESSLKPTESWETVTECDLNVNKRMLCCSSVSHDSLYVYNLTSGLRSLTL